MTTLPAEKNLKTRMKIAQAVEHLSPVDAVTEVAGVLSYLLERVAQTESSSKARAVMEHCFKHIRRLRGF